MSPHPGILCKSRGQNNHRIRPENLTSACGTAQLCHKSCHLCPQGLLSSSHLAPPCPSATVAAVPLLEGSSCCFSPRFALTTCPSLHCLTHTLQCGVCEYTCHPWGLCYTLGLFCFHCLVCIHTGSAESSLTECHPAPAIKYRVGSGREWQPKHWHHNRGHP